jgi:hypothetical protein
MQGQSLVSVMKGNTPGDWRKSFYYHYYEFPGAHSVRRHYGVRTDRYKLMYFYEDDEWNLFDIEKDPSQSTNVIGEFPAVVEQMRSAYEQWWQQTRPRMINEGVPMSPTRPFHELYREQEQTQGIPEWVPPTR